MSDDYWYAAKPASTLARRQGLSVEERGVISTYEDHMHTRDGTIPDERTAEGLDWHRRVLGARDKRTIGRWVDRLLATGNLVRLVDGRLTSEEVQRELARRARRLKAREGGGGQSEGSGGTGSTPAQPVQLTLIEGGKSPQTVVDNPVDEVGAEKLEADSGATSTRLEADLRRKTQWNQRGQGLIIQYNRSHEAVVAESRFSARARGDPLPAPP